MATNKPYLSKRGIHSRDYPNFMDEWGLQVLANPWNKENNPNGFIDFGIAENKLCQDLLSEKVNDQDGKIPSDAFYYHEWRGTDTFREAIGKLITRKFKTYKPVDPENLVVTNGLGAAIDLLSHTIVDPEEYFLAPSPYYYRVTNDSGHRAQARVWNVDLDSQDGFEMTVEKLEAAYKDAIEHGASVRGMILINPHNPMGTIYSKKLVIEILEFAAKYELHVVMDEIYGMSVFGEGAEFNSVLSLENVPDPMRTHVLWGFSKDFCLSGFRCGVIHTINDDIKVVLAHLSYFTSVPIIVQNKLTEIITDDEWLENKYFPTNLKRMKDTFEFITSKLMDIGVPSMKSEACFFVWADFSKFLSEQTHEAEMTLFRQFFDAHVYLMPGQALYCKNPGWFRIVFTLPRPMVEVGVGRIASVLASLKK
ncbi:unnamed protein product [Owenia fusiformis]|uniref:Aminotransferase class I/classII large domain-containing protein n=1 Tax=Owenia fusiformis TaxID=6347 RepID=A0A8J1U0E6_OWEFU|nr:unnamed protein product [Owenia fusiformis]